MTEPGHGVWSLEGALHARGEASGAECAEFTRRGDLSAPFVAALDFIGCRSAVEAAPSRLTPSVEERELAARLMLLKFRVETGEPVWSSWALERVLSIAHSFPGGSAADLATALVGLFADYQPSLSRVLVTFFRDLAVTSFTQHRKAYGAADWPRFIEAFRSAPGEAAGYLAAMVLPDEYLRGCDPDIRGAVRTSPYAAEVIDLLG